MLWGAPTYDQVRIGWEETRRACGAVAAFHQQHMTATIPGGGRITYRSLDDPDNARGHTVDGVVIDEIADVKQEAYYEVLRPMLMDTGGWSWGIGTPKGRNWFYRERQNAAERDDSRVWSVPTLGVEIVGGRLVRKPHPLENPNVPFEEIENLWRVLPERVFRQEVLAEFIEDGGGVFRRVSEATTATHQDAAQPGHDYYIGVDWGRTNDATVFSVVDTTLREQCYVDRMTQTDYMLQVSRLKALSSRFGHPPILAERNSMGGPLVEQLQREGLTVNGFDTTNQSKGRIIDALALAFERGDIRILNDPVQVGELQAYESTTLLTGIRYSAPDGMHDDTVIALALSWQGAITNDVYIGWG